MRTRTWHPRRVRPYVILAPSWTHKSSGVKVLHLLCHALNASGQKAYLVPMTQDFTTNPALNTPPFGTVATGWESLKAEFDPVVVYPDIVTGNPLAAEKVVRYLLAPAGKYGGDKTFPATDKVYGYTRDIAEPTLFLPPYDTDVFYPPEGNLLDPSPAPRGGAVFYAHKYDTIAKYSLLPVTDGATRLTGTPEQIAEALRRAEVCYIYERTEVDIQARLCGCRVEQVISPYWDGKNPEEAVRPDGELVPIDEAMELSRRQLAAFVKDTQEWASP